MSTSNQDNPLMNIINKGGFPLLGLDLWEHAYYLKYQNKRDEYIENFWDVINWEFVNELYKSKTEKKLNESISPKKLLYENVSDYSDIFSNNKNVLWTYRRCIDNTLKRVLSDKWYENNQHSEGSSSGIYDLEAPGRSVINKLNTNYIGFKILVDDLNVSGNYNSYAISFLKEWGNLRAKLEAISDEKARVENIKIYDLVDNDLKEIGGLNGTSLESLGKPTDFIHKDIKKFYTYAEDYNKRFIKEKEGKENTADIVLIYGGSANDVYEALKSGNIEQEDVDSMAKIKNKNVKFALISLKAGSAKLGRVLTQLVSYVGQDIPAVPSKEKPKPLNEGLLDTISQSISTLITKLKGVPDLAKEYYKSFINVINPFTKKISSFFSKELNDNVKQINNSDYKNIQRLENEIEKEIGPVNEAKGKCGKEGAELKDSLFKNMKAFRNILKSDNTDVVLIQKILQYSNNPLLKQNFPILISQEQIESVKNFRSILINLLNSIENDYNVSDCIDRATLNPILKYRANILSLRYIDLILANILKDVNSSDSSKIREEFIKLASVLSTEAVFGNNVSLPLIKFTGKKIEKLKYKRNFKFEVPDKIDDLKLGKLKINIVPDEGYLTVYLYLFNGMVTEDDITVPTYIEYLMKSNSGSAFTFSVEGSKVVEKI